MRPRVFPWGVSFTFALPTFDPVRRGLATPSTARTRPSPDWLVPPDVVAFPAGSTGVCAAWGSCVTASFLLVRTPLALVRCGARHPLRRVVRSGVEPLRGRWPVPGPAAGVVLGVDRSGSMTGGPGRACVWRWVHRGVTGRGVDACAAVGPVPSSSVCAPISRAVPGGVVDPLVRGVPCC